MSAHFHEDTRRRAVNYPPVIRFIGHFFSFVFHPLFIPAYLALYLLYVDAYAYANASAQLKLFRFISVFFLTAFLPAFSILLLKLLRFIDSISLRTQKDRIIPYVICMTFYFWVWYVSKNLHESPAMIAMLLGVFLSSIAGMMGNIYFKISMHGLAAGSLFAFFVWLAFSGPAAIGAYLSLATFISGLMLTARFIVSNHDSRELYAGFIAGMLCQLLAVAIAG